MRALRAALAGHAREVERTASRLRRLGREGAAGHRAALDRARASLRGIADLAAGLDALIGHAPCALLEEEPPTGLAARRAALLGAAFDRLERAIAGPAQSGEMAAASFPYLPFPPDRFAALLQAAWRILAALGRARGARFLEVGAGPGTKLEIAAEVFASAEGLELDPDYRARRSLIGAAASPGTAVHAADATRFSGYGDYDVVYAYYPLRDAARQSALERQIHAQVAPGTVLLAPYVTPTFLYELPQIAPGIVVKGCAGAELETLRRDAELIGPCAPPSAPRGLQDPKDLCGAALDALRWTGFVPLASLAWD